MREILNRWRRDPSMGGVLATVVHVEGSAYRRPGARMLVCPGGEHSGTISGGCLEGDVARKAEYWTAGGKPVVRVYDTLSEEDSRWEFGLGCNGVIYVLLERMQSLSTQAMLGHLDACQRARRETVIATVIRTRGERFAVGQHLFGEALDGELLDAAATSRETRSSCLLELRDADAFVEYIPAPVRLVVFGAGHDAIPLVNAAVSLGWEVTVADVRSGYVKPSRFPGATEVLTLPPAGDVDFAIDRETAVVMMTHNYPLDVRLLPGLLASKPWYLGLLGPWRRTQRLFEEIGVAASGGNLHAPVGLDIGAETPESIALSIVAEIQAAMSGREGGPLRWRSGAIHDPVRVAGGPVARDAFDRESAVCGVA